MYVQDTDQLPLLKKFSKDYCEVVFLLEAPLK